MWLAPIDEKEKEKLLQRESAHCPQALSSASCSTHKNWLWESGTKTFLACHNKAELVALLKKHSLFTSLEQIKGSSSEALLTSQQFLGEKSTIQLGKAVLGSSDFVMMAGPCALESSDMLDNQLRYFKTLGVKVVRAGCYKPRTSPYAFTGLAGHGYQVLGTKCREYEMLSVSEVVDERSAEQAQEWIDIFQIGARNMHNHSLLREVAQYQKPVLLKRGLCATYNEWLLSAECLLNAGCFQVILCERGIRSFSDMGRFTLDLQALCAMRELTHLPVIVDPSHACGKSAWVPSMAKAALAAGADGLLIEVHPHPEIAKCDGEQSLSLHEFEQLYQDLDKACPVFQRRLI